MCCLQLRASHFTLRRLSDIPASQSQRVFGACKHHKILNLYVPCRQMRFDWKFPVFGAEEVH
jgi:hypothetical protein